MHARILKPGPLELWDELRRRLGQRPADRRRALAPASAEHLPGFAGSARRQATFDPPSTTASVASRRVAKFVLDTMRVSACRIMPSAGR